MYAITVDDYHIYLKKVHLFILSFSDFLLYGLPFLCPRHEMAVGHIDPVCVYVCAGIIFWCDFAIFLHFLHEFPSKFQE